MSRVIPRIAIPIFESQTQRLHRAVSNGHLAIGPDLEELEHVLRQRTGRRHVILVSNGFSAVFVAIKFAAMATGPAVSIPVSTCFSIPNAVRASGRTFRFVDLDPGSMGTPRLSPLPEDSMVVAPDHFGYISPIIEECGSLDVPVIHDAAQSFLSLTPAHARSSLVTTLSFYPSKLANGVDGGAILLDDDTLAERIRSFCYYEDQMAPELGFRMNLRLPNLHAAFLLGTLDHVAEIKEHMLKIHARLRAAAQRAGLSVTAPAEGVTPIRFVAKAPSEGHRDNLIEQLCKAGVAAGRELMWLCEPEMVHRYPVADLLVRTTLSLPFHPCLSEADVEYMVQLLG
jgi:dTDP-4-amino-4,6-dideoxygalactose transaminase